MFSKDFKCILVTLLVYSLVMLACALQIRKLSEDMPSDLSHMLTKQEYVLRCNYNIHQCKLQMWQLTIKTIYLIASALQIDNAYRFFIKHISTSENLFMAICIIFKDAFAIPFNFYSDFVIEESYGFNKKTRIQFATESIYTIFFQSSALFLYN